MPEREHGRVTSVKIENSYTELFFVNGITVRHTQTEDVRPNSGMKIRGRFTSASTREVQYTIVGNNNSDNSRTMKIRVFFRKFKKDEPMNDEKAFDACIVAAREFSKRENLNFDNSEHDVFDMLRRDSASKRRYQ
jgi:hypothetical protein